MSFWMDEHMKRSRLSPFLIAILFLLTSPAYAWSVSDTSGKLHNLADYKGKWVLVNFWATWCPPCLAEIPDLESLYRQGKLAVVGVAMNYGSRGEVLDFARKKGMTYPIVLGGEDIASQFGDLDSLPTSFLYSPQGKLVARHEGALSREDLVSAMQGKPLAD